MQSTWPRRAAAALIGLLACDVAALAAPPNKPCAAPEFHRWDFWLGSWRVTDPKGVFQGTNAINVAPSGCGLIEHWHGASGSDGMSFNGYDAARGTWTQLWLSPGTVIRLEGRFDDQGALRMSGTITYNQKREEHAFRGNWVPLPDGAVRQEFFERTSKTTAWTEWFTGIYRRPAQAATTVSCTEPEFRQFDFWIGRWDVFDTKSGERAGSSLIENLYGGCAIRENWSEPGFAGGSLNTFSATDRRWHQTWVDQRGARREFIGGMKEGAMALTALVPSQKEPGKMVLLRMRFATNPDGSVRQYSDYSTDGGKTWAERYDYTYRRAFAS